MNDDDIDIFLLLVDFFWRKPRCFGLFCFHDLLILFSSQAIPCSLDRADEVMDTCNNTPSSPQADGRPGQLCVLGGGDVELEAQVRMALFR